MTRAVRGDVDVFVVLFTGTKRIVSKTFVVLTHPANAATHPKDPSIKSNSCEVNNHIVVT